MKQDAKMLLPKKELRISITSKCNMKCVYCHNEGNEKNAELNITQIRKIIEAALDYGLTSVRLTGGEPLVHPHIEEICQMLAREYGLSVGINTNGILIPKLLPLIRAGLVDRVVVGIDYFHHAVSKQSPIGVPSHIILENVLKVRDTGCDVNIDVVFQDNYNNIANMVRWGIDNRIRVKIIEEVKRDVSAPINSSYSFMEQKILEQFHMDCVKDSMNEINGYIGDFRAVSFLHSLCRLGDCEICKLNMPLRITASGILKPCIIHSENDITLDETEIQNSFIYMLKNFSYRV